MLQNTIFDFEKCEKIQFSKNMLYLYTMELRRKAADALKKWKQRKNHRPLIIEGLRQVGKSYVALSFAKANYDDVVFFDFRHDKSLEDIFQNPGENGKMSVETIIRNAKVHFPSHSFTPGHTCLIFDEVGDCPLARESFKLFAVSSDYDVIATGSLLGIAGVNEKSRKDTPVGYEEYLEMTALDFEEFLWANQVSDEAIEQLKKSVQDFSEISPTYHHVFSSYLLRYLVVGGMPQAVLAYLDSDNILAARDVLIALRKGYEDDFGKRVDAQGNTILDPTLLIRTLRAYRSIPDQLAKENKKFKYSAIEGGGRGSEFSDALMWLEKAGIITRAYNLRAIEKPLSGNAISDQFKVYPSDIGLLTAAYPISFSEEILKGDMGAYKGAVYEALAAETLFKAGEPLYYYSDTKRHLENDFLLEGVEGIDIVESKATNGKMASAKALATGNSPYSIHRVYKLARGNFSIGDYYYSLPQYAFLFLLEQKKKEAEANLKLPPLPKI